MEEFYGPFMETVNVAMQTVEKVQIADEVSDVPCDKCGAMMVYKMSRYGRFLACPNFPNCRNTKPIVEKISVPCPKCGAAIIKKKSKNGKVFFGCETYPTCDFTSWDQPVEQRCPKCGGIMTQRRGRNGSYVGCANKECGYILRKTKKTTDEEA